MPFIPVDKYTSQGKTRYSMSSVGGCPRAVVAEILHYDLKEPPEFMQIAATEGVRHEEWVARDLHSRFGWTCDEAVHCSTCNRDGVHVELERNSYCLVGHIDRLAIHETLRQVLVEIKSLGKMRSTQLVNSLAHSTFAADFPQYAFQVSCYHYASNLPILYVVKNRDTGYINTFEIPSPLSLEDIDEYVMGLELAVRKQKLPACRYGEGSFERKFCKVGYLCAGEDIEVVTTPSIDIPTIEAGIKMWKEGHLQAELGKETMDKAKAALEPFVKQMGKIVTDGVRVSYVPEVMYNVYKKDDLEKIIPEEWLKQARSFQTRAGYTKVEEV